MHHITIGRTELHQDEIGSSADDLETMIWSPFRDQHQSSIIIDGDPQRCCECDFAIALGTIYVDGFAVFREFLHPIVARITHKDRATVRIEIDISGKPETALAGALPTQYFS